MTDILHWWRCCMLIDCQEDNNFHQYRILMKQTGCYPHINYVGIVFVVWEQFFHSICDGFHLQDFLWWVLEKHDPSRWDIIPLFGGYAHHDTSLWALNIYKHFLLPSYIRGLLPWFSLIRLPECSWILFEICLCGAVTVSNIVKFLSTIIAGDMVNVSLVVLFHLFFFTFIIPSFPMLCKYKSVADTLVLVLTIIVIIRLVI